MKAVGALIALALLAVGPARAEDPLLRSGGAVSPEVERIYERGLAWLAGAQNEDGSWKDSYEGCGVNGICLMAFLAGGTDPNYGPYAPVIRRALRAIVRQQNAETGYLPNSMYHHGFAMLALSEAYGAVDESLLWEGGKPRRTLAQALELAIRCAATAQKKNRWGGWRYNPDSNDADTSVTGAVLMGLLAARNAGMEVPDEVIAAALEYMHRSTGADGSVAYSGGFGGMNASMNLTAVSVLVGAVTKTKDAPQYKACLKRLVENMERREPNGHKEYYRYYMAQALFQGDYAAWQKWNAATVAELHDEQREDGSFAPGSYSTGMSLLALALNYRFLPIYER